MPAASIRCYAELNDFLPLARRQRAFSYRFTVPGSVKDALESLGIPHPEIDLILVNGLPAGFDQHLADGDRVAVYPRLRSFDISGLSRVHVPLPVPPRFALDGHLGRLARYLRLLGFDSTHQPQVDDATLADLAAAEGRVLLTRDLDLLKRRVVRLGYRVRATEPARQVEEVVRHFALTDHLDPFSRCLACGQRLLEATAEEAQGRVPPAVAARHPAFRRCPQCDRFYWPGSHHRRLLALVERARAAGRPAP